MRKPLVQRLHAITVKVISPASIYKQTTSYNFSLIPLLFLLKMAATCFQLLKLQMNWNKHWQKKC